MNELAGFFKAAADSTRLRILRLLAEESLNVGEVTSILGMAQSSVSKHLAALRRAKLVDERREGGFVYYALNADNGLPRRGLLLSELRAAGDERGDLARLAEVRRSRTDRGDGGQKLIEPGRSWVAWARALHHLLPPLRVVDLGCGDGALTAEIAAWAKSVVAIERNATHLARARERIERAGLTNVSFIHDDIAAWRPRAADFDLAVVSHVLHYPGDPAAIVERARLALKPGGRVLVLDLLPHHETWVEEKLGHARLGWHPAELRKLLEGAGFSGVEVEPSPDESAKKPFRIVIATGVVREQARSRRGRKDRA